jgi:phage baseplate assembly protein W
MAINQEITVYGREAPKPANYVVKSTGTKYSGFKFPFNELEDGFFLKKASDIEVVKSGLRQLLLTSRGERVMLPKFGTNLKKYLMEPLDQALLSQIRREIVEAISLYARNVVITKLQVFPLDGASSGGGHTFKVVLFCQIQEADNLGFELSVEVQ